MRTRGVALVALAFAQCGGAGLSNSPPVVDFAEIGPVDYRPLRRELRAFHPAECHGKCKSEEVLASHEKMRAEVRAYADAHSDFDALDLRREYYGSLVRHFRPVLFRESPFYFEAGVNGGWAEAHNPARVVGWICRKFYQDQSLVPKSAFDRLYERRRQCYSLCCGPFVDDEHHLPPFRTIFAKGFKGVRDDVAEALKTCPADDPHGRKELETALAGLDAIHAVQLRFAAEAEKRANGLVEGEEKKRLLRIVESAQRCPWEPPRNFYEGLNTFWFMREILALVDGIDNFSIGRGDAWLIDFYRHDLRSGALTEAEVRDLVRRFMIHAECHHDGMVPVRTYNDHEAEIPLTLGGCDADGKPLCNELTMMFLEEHQKMDLVFPKLHVRFSASSPKEYLEKIASMVLGGHAVFAMFNDDAAIPMFRKMGYPLDRARDYVCTGCWDGNVDSMTDVDCANYMSVIRVIEATIHRDEAAAAKVGLRLDPIDGAKSYDEVERIIFANFLRFLRDTCADYVRYGRANAKVFPHPVYSMCLDGGIETRRDTTDGGVRFRPRVMTLAFLANAVDSLCAIRKVVFEDRFCTLDEFLAAVRANWKGERAQAIRGEVLKAPYWGDNSPASNALMRKWIDTVADNLDGLKNDQGGPFVLACWIYREFLFWGKMTKATPDGRYDGEQLAQGFAPSELRCRSCVADVFHALSSIDHSRLFASNANLMFGGEDLTPETFAGIFRVFADTGAHLLQPNCNDVATLREAQKHPERYQHLMVKVCGFSARFIALSPEWQEEVIRRHRLR